MTRSSGYVSFGHGEYAVMVQGMPVCNNKKTLAEAIRAAEFMRVDLHGEAWNGERGEWVHLNTIEEAEKCE